MRIATFNILHGRSLRDGRVDLDRYAEAVRGLDADVLALQEVDRDQQRSHGADLTEIAAEAMGATDHRFAATLRGHPGLWTAVSDHSQPASATYGIALLSRYPVREWSVLTLSMRNRLTPVRWTGKRWWSLARDEPRAALVAEIDAPGGPTTVVGTHLTVIPGWVQRQLVDLHGRVSSRPRPLVLMGDLNLVGAEPARLTGMRPLVTTPTFPVEHPRRQIDHVLVEGNLHAIGPGRAVDTGISDHRALVVDVEHT
ncbi:endonuclease/exonuclease/phosphatase family protein [Cellulomonas alba]|uniref:Endonuclease/exonuclease/phosphatase family protein n=1 Tax=Cellulomonas alba TaxID=3053467 RepID=A0ABT7SJI5_9CELL|nr:endonuclease/exonuclease/phosphatase family protein [Cellulomonas alba]MDM7856348.1 endonuclease/exonuclease/phosphatase family protein [Cellulomonas alba]